MLVHEHGVAASVHAGPDRGREKKQDAADWITRLPTSDHRTENRKGDQHHHQARMAAENPQRHGPEKRQHAHHPEHTHRPATPKESQRRRTRNR
jgi:hypothetical protein